MLLSKLPSWVASTLTLLIAFTVAITLQIPRLNSITDPKETSPQAYKRDEQLQQFRIQLLKQFPTFGFKNLKADWAMLQFLQYFGDQPARQVTGYGLTLDYFEIILNNDPRFLDAYKFLSTSGTIYAAQPEQTNQLMEQGIQHLTPQVPRHSYYALRHKGINEILFLGDNQEAKKSFEKAAEWAKTYEDEESQRVAQMSQNTADFLAKNPNSKSAQVSAWVMVLQSVKDEQTQKIALNEIQKLGGKITTTPEGKVNIQLPKE
ncbi:hypothetical protein PN462_10395 [Spirulina sp. CS-785/01]|uniref:hypothetical protein n=1 Tax=Spirulina sp. CS-785/01 TaxID=3021716 RepID=UPI00232CBDB9|nr:hypothetical protein [Spirulina sp. CS-785/01]MDB9313508.1 hypothetical protein [Spirulina sp. CS-785/01]